MSRVRALPGDIEKATKELQQLKRELKRANERIAERPIHAFDARQREAANRFAQGLVRGWVVAIAIAVAFGAWRCSRLPEDKEQSTLESAAHYRSEARRLETEAGPLPAPTEGTWLLPSPPASSDRPLYPALERYRSALPDRQKADVLLRWVNVGVAACTVGEKETATWVLGKLRAMDAERSVQRDEPNDVDRGVASVMLRCSARGHDLLPSLDAAE